MKALLMILIIMLVGTSFVSPVNTTVATITTPTYSQGTASIFTLFPLLMGIAILWKVKLVLPTWEGIFKCILPNSVNPKLLLEVWEYRAKAGIEPVNA
ncbi:MAG: hypothetical protein WC822_06050 [Candidatus Paceibacterota bacterium]